MPKRKPSPRKRTTHLFVSPKLKDQIRLGHPWIYRDAIERAPAGLPAGAWVRVQSANQQAIGVWDDRGPIAVRLFSATTIPDAAWVRARVEEAWRRREPIRQHQPPTTAYRWIYGENDGLPGIVVDLYGDETFSRQWAVIKVYSPSLERIMRLVVDALPQITPLAGIILREDAEWRMLAGSPPEDEIIILEHGVRFAVDMLRGQKTGFFLDQRENRATIRAWSQGKRVLNLFSYTGGFSVYAAMGQAQEVISVDSAAPAIATAKHNFRLNGFDPAAHGFVVGDAFEVLTKYHGEGQRFDLIIVDPPSFARSKSQVPQAVKAYRRLHTLAMKCLKPHGILAAASCTAQISPTQFRNILADAAADAQRRILLLHDAGQPLDHPVAAHFPEGRYLKFMLGEVVPRG